MVQHRDHLPTLKRIVGVVVSTGMDRTAVVAVPRLRIHHRTRRYVNFVQRFFCHDHHEVCGVGDKVHIKFCGQVSKKKFWSVIDMVERHPQLEGEPFPMSRLRTNPITGAPTTLTDNYGAASVAAARAAAAKEDAAAEAAQRAAADAANAKLDAAAAGAAAAPLR